MTRLGLGVIALGLGVLVWFGGARSLAAQPTAPPRGDYKKLSDLVAVPDFLPGLGTLYVEPARMPVGPYLAYDRQGHLVSTIYMVPLAGIETHTKFAAPEGVSNRPVDHVDLVYDPGHPGLAEPHYNVILWYLPKAQAAALK